MNNYQGNNKCETSSSTPNTNDQIVALLKKVLEEIMTQGEGRGTGITYVDAVVSWLKGGGDNPALAQMN